MDVSDSSSTTEQRKFLHEDEKNVQIFATQMLKTRIFLGHYQEKRYVESLKSYRDVIVLSDSETELKKVIDIVRKRLKDFYGAEHWIGLTDPEYIGAPSGYCLWVESENETLGRYWYRIKDVRFRRKEVIVKIKKIRPMQEADVTGDSTINNFSDLIDSMSVDDVKRNILTVVSLFFTEILTIHNIIETIKFLSVLLMTCLTFSVKGIEFFMNFILKFMREISVFVHASTPVMVAVVNFFGKVVGGFYYLIVMFWKDSTQPKSYVEGGYRALPQQNYRMLDAGRRSIQYGNHRRNNSVTITEIE